MVKCPGKDRGGICMHSNQPGVGDCYSIAGGETIQVIGMGTHGIVIEYNDGRAELIDRPDWLRLHPRKEASCSTTE